MASVGTLKPWLQPYARELMRWGKYNDSKLVFTSTYRSWRKQKYLYNEWIMGRSVIPAAPPGRSLHEQGLAFDMARPGVDPLTDPLLNWLGSVWSSWGGQYGGARDPVHFQPRM